MCASIDQAEVSVVLSFFFLTGSVESLRHKHVNTHVSLRKLGHIRILMFVWPEHATILQASSPACFLDGLDGLLIIAHSTIILSSHPSTLGSSQNNCSTEIKVQSSLCVSTGIVS
mmetsp:Transcript_3076/g.4077  ORF Transcript_3076/g.4077 Transcript_3076/m.4077 type:complete len:115 (+) Transcript_3076:107-451(+)